VSQVLTSGQSSDETHRVMMGQAASRLPSALLVPSGTYLARASEKRL
jgi:hypothetical protein